MPEVWPYVWPQWIAQATTAGTSNVQNVCVQNVWFDWQNTAATYPTTTTIVNATWEVWQNGRPLPHAGTGQQYVPQAAPTAEEVNRRQLIVANRSRASMLRRSIAGRRAERLLLENLNPTQRGEWLTERAFTVHTADGRRAYKIAYGLEGNVRLVGVQGDPPVSKHGHPLRVGARFCAHVYHPDGRVPHEDNVLAQKLLIESNERGFLDLANVS